MGWAIPGLGVEARGGCSVDRVMWTRDGAPKNCRVVVDGWATVKEGKGKGGLDVAAIKAAGCSVLSSGG